uniref:Uncharacterized protein n=1 Tax=Schistocephalus solidus TaxID=70667 RepID=A0A0X3Q8F0_SCHSO
MLSESRYDENNRNFVPLKSSNLETKQGVKKRGLQVSDPNVENLSKKEYVSSKTVITKPSPRNYDVEVCIPPRGEDFSSAFILCDAVDELFDHVSAISVKHMSTDCRSSNDYQTSTSFPFWAFRRVFADLYPK